MMRGYPKVTRLWDEWQGTGRASSYITGRVSLHGGSLSTNRLIRCKLTEYTLGQWKRAFQLH